MMTVMLGLTVTMNNALYESTQQTNAAATVATVGEIMYTDLNQAVASGFWVANPSWMVFQADTSMGAGRLATVTYFVTDDATTGLHSLYRKIGTRSVCLGKNLVSVNFQYLDPNGHSTWQASAVNSIRVKLVAEVSGVSQGSSTTMNDFRAYPPNLN